MRSFIAAVIALCLSPILAIELYTTTADVVRDAPYVSSVMVEEGRLEGGLLVYDLVVLEDFKRSLPEKIRLRMPVGAEIGANRNPAPAGSEWIVMLGEPRDGTYPLRSVTWGHIPIYVDETGEKVLSKNLTGMGGGQFAGKPFLFREFREYMRAHFRGKP